jgi:hypothetical protein
MYHIRGILVLFLAVNIKALSRVTTESMIYGSVDLYL